VPDLALATGSYQRLNGRLPPLEVVNMFAEQTPTAKSGVALLSRKGLDEVSSLSADPIIGVFQRDGLFGGDIFSLTSGGQLYRGTTLLGTVNGTGPASMAGSTVELVVTRGTTAYSYNGTDLAAIAFPDSASVTAVTFIGGMFVFARAGSGRFYWSAVLNGRIIDPLDYATAESAPDALLDVVAIGDNLYLLGEETTEVHFLTSDLTLPFQRINQRTVSIGVKATGCAIEVDNALHFIGSDNIVYRMAEVPQRISHHGLEELVGASAAFRCFSWSYEGHVFFAVRLSQGTWAMDMASPGLWPEFQTHGLTNWMAGCAVVAGGEPVFGSASSGKLLGFGENWTDDGVALIRIFTSALPLGGGSVPIDSIEIEANSGSSTGAAASLELESSRDGGNTWSDPRMSSLGAMGEYRKRASYRRLGMFDAPGAMFRHRMSDAAPLRVSAVRANESSAGRSR
jgi:hypothetical protein